MKNLFIVALLSITSYGFSQTKSDTIAKSAKLENTAAVVETKEQKRDRILKAMRARSERARRMMNNSAAFDSVTPKKSDKDTFTKVFQTQ
ncbi:hypothetical protein [Flavobacterium ardleyense]|uniref:hypothetical protein n=1 Tax=Flavobacterium ardleyense TaxID=2038737 RepID=UPI00298BE296|nr:hypothetical protein [Flavobacterium ardleyense]